MNGSDHDDRGIPTRRRTAHAQPRGGRHHRPSVECTIEIEDHHSKPSRIEHVLDGAQSSEMIDWRHPKHTLQVDTGGACTTWIERVWEVDPRGKLSRESHSGNQDLREGRSSRGNAPEDLGNGSARETTTESGIEHRESQREMNARTIEPSEAKIGNYLRSKG
jgi:hypothetical protein